MGWWALGRSTRDPWPRSQVRAKGQGLLQGVQIRKGDFASWAGHERDSPFGLVEEVKAIDDVGLI